MKPFVKVIDTAKQYYKNVYIDLRGYLCAAPFEFPRDGLWYFDGQIYYPAPSKSNVGDTNENQ